MTSQRSHEDTHWRAALEEYRAAKDRAAGAFRPDAKTCAELLARVAGVVRKGRSSPAGHDDATQRAAAAREIVDAPRGTWFLGADAAARQTSGGGRKGAAPADGRAGGRRLVAAASAQQRAVGLWGPSNLPGRVPDGELDGLATH